MRSNRLGRITDVTRSSKARPPNSVRTAGFLLAELASASRFAAVGRAAPESVDTAM